MLCENCGKREANVRYEENINGRKREMNLCEECSRELGIGRMDFSMPINFSNFMGGFLEDFGNTEFMPMLSDLKTLKCDSCGYTFNDITKTGKLGCGDCYDIFGTRLDPILKRIQGENHHVGRLGKEIDKKIDEKFGVNNNQETEKQKSNKKSEDLNKKKDSKLEELKESLKKAIKEERYEEAASLRDQIKNLEK